MLKLNKITPVFNNVLTTKNMYDTDVRDEAGVIVETKGTLKMYQTVLAVGPQVKNCQVGDLIMLDLTRYAQMKHKEGSLHDGVVEDNPAVAYSVPTVKVDGKECLLIGDNAIRFIIEDYTDEPEAPALYVAPAPQIIC